MFKKLLAFFAAMSLFAAFAAVDINKASEAELDGIKGVGPATTRLIVAERKKSEFKSWDDFIARVKGVGAKSATKFSAEGLTVGGASYSGASATASKTATEKTKSAAVQTKNTTKDAVKETPKATAAKPAASAVK